MCLNNVSLALACESLPAYQHDTFDLGVPIDCLAGVCPIPPTPTSQPSVTWALQVVHFVAMLFAMLPIVVQRYLYLLIFCHIACAIVDTFGINLKPASKQAKVQDPDEEEIEWKSMPELTFDAFLDNRSKHIVDGLAGIWTEEELWSYVGCFDRLLRKFKCTRSLAGPEGDKDYDRCKFMLKWDPMLKRVEMIRAGWVCTCKRDIRTCARDFCVERLLTSDGIFPDIQQRWPWGWSAATYPEEERQKDRQWWWETYGAEREYERLLAEYELYQKEHWIRCGVWAGLEGIGRVIKGVFCFFEVAFYLLGAIYRHPRAFGQGLVKTSIRLLSHVVVCGLVCCIITKFF